MDRIVQSIVVLSKFARTEYESLASKEKSQIHFVSFDDILSKTSEVIEGTSLFLKRSPHHNIGGVLARERVSRVIPENQRNNLLQEIRAHMSPSMNKTLELLVEEFDSYWMNLARQRVSFVKHLLFFSVNSFRKYK